MRGDRVVRVLDALAAQAPAPLPDRLCTAASELLDVDGVGLALETGDGELQTVAANGLGEGAERLQADLGEGPAYRAYQRGLPVLVADLASDPTWLAFGPAALASGVAATFAFPLHSGTVRVGALTLYRGRADDLTDEQYADALVFARLALDLFLSLQAGGAEDDLDRLLADQVDNSAQVHQASGMVSVQLGISVQAALAVLRAAAYAADRSLHAVADDVVGHRLRMDDST